MKWLALVDQLLYGQQPNLTGVLQRQSNFVIRLGRKEERHDGTSSMFSLPKNVQRACPLNKTCFY